VEWVAIVTCIVLLQTFLFAIQVGQQRVKHNVKAPAVTGPEEFERAFRVHENTVEQLVIFIPALWVFANYVRADVAAGLGLLFVIGRQVYRHSYMRDPDARSAGFGIGALAMMSCVIGGLIGAVLSLL
jgi:glutathione S-transferase